MPVPGGSIADGNPFSYDKLADELIPYVKEMGYTHIELMPMTEYPYDGSWGYQVTGYFAPTARYGDPKEFMRFVDRCHQAGIGVIIDWVPAHFPRDIHGLATISTEPAATSMRTREKASIRIGEPWCLTTGRNEVISFLISSAAVLAGKVPHRWHPGATRWPLCSIWTTAARMGNGCPTNTAVRKTWRRWRFCSRLNESALRRLPPDVMMIAEESTSWPMVSKPTYAGGLGFNYKWNMGWMNDMLHYMSLDPLYRSFNHDNLTFSFFYAFSENFILPVSHDEVVHGKGSLINKMPGTVEQKFANTRAFLAYMMAHPGKKLHLYGYGARPV